MNTFEAQTTAGPRPYADRAYDSCPTVRRQCVHAGRPVDPDLGKTGSRQWFTPGMERRDNGEAIDVSVTGVVVAVALRAEL